MNPDDKTVIELIAQMSIGMLAILGAFLFFALTWLRGEIDDYRMRIINHIIDKEPNSNREKYYKMDDDCFNNEIDNKSNQLIGNRSSLNQSIFDDDFELFKSRYNNKQKIIKFFTFSTLILFFVFSLCLLLIKLPFILKTNIQFEIVFFTLVGATIFSTLTQSPDRKVGDVVSSAVLW